MQKLLTKAKFADLAGVNPSTVTRLVDSILQPAVVGKRIDAAHPVAVEYLEKRDRVKTPPAATGLDPYYEAAVQMCQYSGRYSVTYLKGAINVGENRARKLLEVMRLNGVVPAKGEEPKVVKVPEGQSAKKLTVKEKKKAASNPEEPVDLPNNMNDFLDFTLGELMDKFGTDTRFVDWLNATQKIEQVNEKRLKNAQTKGDLVSRRLVKTAIIDVFNSAHLRLLKDGAKTIAAGAVSKQVKGAELSEIEAYVADILGSFIRPIKSKITRALKENKVLDDG